MNIVQEQANMVESQGNESVSAKATPKNSILSKFIAKPEALLKGQMNKPI